MSIQIAIRGLQIMPPTLPWRSRPKPRQNGLDPLRGGIQFEIPETEIPTLEAGSGEYWLNDCNPYESLRDPVDHPSSTSSHHVEDLGMWIGAFRLRRVRRDHDPWGVSPAASYPQQSSISSDLDLFREKRKVRQIFEQNRIKRSSPAVRYPRSSTPLMGHVAVNQ